MGSVASKIIDTPITTLPEGYKPSANEEFMNDFDAILASFQERLNIQENTRNNLYLKINRKTKKDG